MTKDFVKWRWWYPEGCIRAEDGGWDKHALEMRVGCYDADDIAAEIIQTHVNENGNDGCNSFEIEIAAPAFAAGIYDVELEWEPTAVATRRTVPA